MNTDKHKWYQWDKESQRMNQAWLLLQKSNKKTESPRVILTDNSYFWSAPAHSPTSIIANFHQ